MQVVAFDDARPDTIPCATTPAKLPETPFKKAHAPQIPWFGGENPIQDSDRSAQPAPKPLRRALRNRNRQSPGRYQKIPHSMAKPGLPAVRGGYASRPPSRIFRSEIKRRQIFVENAFHRQTPPPPRRRRRTIRVFGYSAEFSAGTGPFSARTRAISRLPIERSSASLAFAPALGEVLPSSQ